MKITTIKCDVCEVEIPEESALDKDPSYKHNLGVVFLTDQSEGRPSKPYISPQNLDVCKTCMERVLRGNYIFASGAMGHNNYRFRTNFGGEDK